MSTLKATPLVRYCFANTTIAWFSRGRSRLVEVLWLVLDALLVRSRVPGSAHRRLILRAFGALIGKRVLIKPGVRIKFPWRLEIGDDSWVGEDVWIDNLAPVQIGANCCISQGVYICTGSHDWGAADLRSDREAREDRGRRVGSVAVGHRTGCISGRGGCAFFGQRCNFRFGALGHLPGRSGDSCEAALCRCG